MPINLTELEMHELYLSRLASGGINAHIYPSLEASYKAIRRILQDEEVITTQAQLNKVLTAVARAIDENGGWVTLTNESLQALAVYEAGWQAQFIGAALATAIRSPAEKKILSYINKALMSLESGQRTNSGTWEQFYRANLDSRKKAINSIIRTGYSRGETINQISQKIRTNFNGVLKREAETLARTGYIHYASAANTAMVNDNLDILNEWFYVVTFDSRTSDTCQAISTKNAQGNRYKTTDPRAPNPPLHFNAVAGGEMVLTENGNKPIENVAVGEKVLTHKGRYKKVLTVMKKTNDSGVIRIIRFKSGREIRVTDEHPVLVSGSGWIRADEVKVGDCMFEQVSKKRPVSERSPVVERNPYNYPSLFDGEEVFTQVAVESGSMASTINLDSNLIIDVSKVTNRVANNKLMDKRSVAKEVFKRLFSNNDATPVNISHRFNDFLFGDGVFHGVGLCHPSRMCSMDFASFFSHAVSPVGGANTDATPNSDDGSFFSGFGFIKRLYTMDSTPPTHCSVSKFKFSFDSAKRFSERVVLFFKKIMEELFISKVDFNVSNVHWDTSIVSSISIVGHNKEVYNLEVEEDNTYLVDNIVVHNCRTRRIGVQKGAELTGTRAAMSAKESGKEAFEKRDKARRKASQVRYRGRKDNNIFKPEQINANTTYDSWLRSQPDYYIKDTLGATKYKLFKEGGLSMKSFADMAGRPLTLDEIIKRHPVVAERVLG